MNKIEEWRPIQYFEGIYEVSSNGRVRSIDRVIDGYGPAGARKEMRRGVELKGSVISSGYLTITLCARGVAATALIHRLVLMAFVGPCPDGLVACHFDGDKTNNTIENLRWDTRSSNEHDKVSHGTSNRGERCGNSKITTADAAAIKVLSNLSDLSQREIGGMYGVSDTNVRHIKQGDTWQELPSANLLFNAIELHNKEGL